MFLGFQSLHALQLFPFVGDFPSLFVVVHNIEAVAGLGCSVQSQYQNGGCRSCLVDSFPPFVEHCLNPSGISSGKHYIAYLQCTALYQYGRYITAPFVERRFDDNAVGFLVRVCFQIEQFGFQQYFFEQLIDVHPFFCRNFLRLVFSAPIFHKVIHCGELFSDFVRVGTFFIYFVDSEYNGNACGRSVVDSFYGLRHHIVVGCNDDNRYVGNTGSTCTHSGKRFVSRSVEEGDSSPVVHFHAVSADMLGNSPCFVRYHVRFTDKVQ